MAEGALAALWGMDANWDLRNYHYYNGFALATGRAGWDMLAAQIPTFYNPTLDLPYYLAVQVLPARLVAFLIGSVQGTNFILLTLIARLVIAPGDPLRQTTAAVGIALAGLLGAGALSEAGTVFYDTVISLGIFASALAVLLRWDMLVRGRASDAAAAAVLAGLPVGLAFGLKQPTVIFAIGLCVGLLSLPATPRRRVFAAFFFGIGVLVGLAAAGGHWMWHLWQSYGNPLLPYFNQVFHSPWALSQSYRDPAYLPPDLWGRLRFVWDFSLNSRKAAEIDIQDFRILAAIVAMLLAGLSGLLRALLPSLPTGPLPGGGLVRAGAAQFLLLSCFVAYAVWLAMFCIYRYVIPLEMLAPLLVVCAFGLLPIPLPLSSRAGAALATLIFLTATTRTNDWLRVPFQEKDVSAEVPTIADPAHTLVLIAGHEPLSFLLPSFPHSMRFLRIDSTFTNWDEPDNGFNRTMRALSDSHEGPLAALFIPSEAHDAIPRLAQYGLALRPESCLPVTSPIGAGVYHYCTLIRQNINTHS